jgi:hypothetical protein
VDTKRRTERTFNRAALAAVAAVVFLGGGLICWFLLRGPATAPAEISLTPEAKAYTRNLKLSEVEMKATENLMKVTVVEILGKITNAGDRTLNLVAITCIFYDINGVETWRERVPIVRDRGGAGLKPGETRGFRLPFDELPATWNQAMPQMVIAGIEFAGE